MGSFQQGIRPSLLAFRTLARSTSACGAGPVDSGRAVPLPPAAQGPQLHSPAQASPHLPHRPRPLDRVGPRTTDLGGPLPSAGMEDKVRRDAQEAASDHA
ncbi:hypothetical protein M2161_004605 [Streptomyces sp. SAI-133]|uniref:hypothetical protein n=1 Tax=unclassified Streptomyces TaxID=2593676 RepID=UPI0024743A5C|nr:hypothetical protein [Streptomyces sp. SAI-133]MDH6585499.1 hypothetical protein [Streptomyces sp. SAI-133]